MTPTTEELRAALTAVLAYLHEDLTEYRLLCSREDSCHIGRYLLILQAYAEHLRTAISSEY